MKIVATMPVRNEGCYVGLTLRAALMWVDEAVVLLHACTDDSTDIVFQIAEENPGRIHVIIEPDETWREMMHRQRMLQAARQEGATHIAIIDSDEILTGDSLDWVRDFTAVLKPGCFAGIKMHNLHRSLNEYRSDPGVWGQRAGTLTCFHDSPNLSWRGDRFHSRHPEGSRRGLMWPAPIAVMHLQFANWRRLTAKHALYKITERIRWPQKFVPDIDALYNQALDETRCETSPVPASWWEPYRDIMHHLDIEREPWQEAECARLIEKHGAETFSGLNLFGLDRQFQTT